MIESDLIEAKKIWCFIYMLEISVFLISFSLCLIINYILKFYNFFF